MAYVRHYVMQSSPENADALGRNLVRLREAVTACQGSLRVDFLRDLGEPGRFFFIEHWASKDDHTAAGPRLPPDTMAAIGPLLTGRPVATDLADATPA